MLLFFLFFVCLGSATTTAVETAPPDISEESKTKDINDKTNDKDTKDDNHDVAEALLGSKEHKDQLNVDVKIGDGMDIAIHGENGTFYRIAYTKFYIQRDCLDLGHCLSVYLQ